MGNQSKMEDSNPFGNPNQDDRINETRKQVNDVVDVMRNNVTKMMEREDKLNDLDRRADNLQNSSIQFASTSRRLKKKMWWENMKMKLVIGGVLVAILLIIIIVICVETKKPSGGGDNGETTKPSLETTTENNKT